jgi:4'-phosphopantetheinyl transferase
VELPVAGRILRLVRGPALARLDSVGSLAEWRQTEARAQPSGAGSSGGGRMSRLNTLMVNTAVRCMGVAA